ncbi:MAG TPA: CBS domain-containing protein [Armatimonadota bacterium]|nr:CBS domain-containing protein [Armatimonadota bacterium]
MQARDIMTEQVTTVFEGATVAEAARLMHGCGRGGMPVVNAEGEVVGVVDRLSLLRLILPKYAADIGDLSFLPEDFKPFESRIEEVGHMLVRDVMRPCDVCLTADTSVVELAAVMVTKEVTDVPIVREEHVVGMVSLQDIVDEIVWPHFKRPEDGE